MWPCEAHGKRLQTARLRRQKAAFSSVKTLGDASVTGWPYLSSQGSLFDRNDGPTV